MNIYTIQFHARGHGRTPDKIESKFRVVPTSFETGRYRAHDR